MRLGLSPRFTIDAVELFFLKSTMTSRISMPTSLRKVKADCPPLLSDKTVIERMWHGSLVRGKELPQYEDVVLGSLGRLGDHLLLFEGGASSEFKVLRAGWKIREWLGAD